MYETNAIGLDTSHYDENIDESHLEGNVDFLIIKAGGSENLSKGIYLDARFAERVQMAHDINVPALAYWFVGPQYWINRQYTMEKINSLSDEDHPLLQQIMYQLKNKEVYALFFDVENDSIELANDKTVSDTWVNFYISDLVKRIRRQQRAGNMRDFKLGVYSRKSFIEDPTNRQTSLEAYLGTQSDLFIWTANWITGTGATLEMSEIYKLRPTHSPLTYGYCPDRSADWQFWQFSGDVGKVYRSPAITNASGYARGLDINLYNGTPAQLYEWLGYSKKETSETETEGETNTGEEDTTPDTTETIDVSIINEKLEVINTKQDEILGHLNNLAWLERE